MTPSCNIGNAGGDDATYSTAVTGGSGSGFGYAWTFDTNGSPDCTVSANTSTTGSGGLDLTHKTATNRGPCTVNGNLAVTDLRTDLPAGACTAETSGDVEAAGVVVAGAIEPRLGAAGRADPVVAVGAGVDAAVVVALGSAAWGAEEGLPPLIPIIVWAAYATAAARTTPRTITVFFCFAAFSFAVSLGLFRATSRSFLAD